MPKPQFEANGFFSVIFPKSGSVMKAELGVESEIANNILIFLEKTDLGKKDIALKLGKKKPTRYLNDLVSQLVDAELIEYKIPAKPNSRLQKYQLTAKGKKIANGTVANALESPRRFRRDV